MMLPRRSSSPELATEHLVVRTFAYADLPAIHEIMNRAFGEDSELGTEGALHERESWLRWSILNQQWLPMLHQPPYGDRAVVLRSTGQLVGAVGYVPLLVPFAQIPELCAQAAAPGLFTPEVGLYWVIDPSYRRQGYATEAARALIDDAFSVMRLARILATTEYDNQASQAVMRKLGMLIARNPLPEPTWLQVVGILLNPG